MVHVLQWADYSRDGAFHFARYALPHEAPATLHTHDFAECFWIESGEGLHHVNGQIVPLRPGQFVFVRPTDVHAFQSRGPAVCRLTNVAIDNEVPEHLQRRYGAELGPRFFWARTALPHAIDLHAHQWPELERLQHHLERGARSLSRIEAFLLEVLTGLFADTGNLGGHAPEWLARACLEARQIDVMREGTAGFVRAAGRSHEHVCRATQKHLGLSPSSYMRTVRMEYAARRLSGSDEPVIDVALDCGFDSLSHFYRQFRAQFGMPPRAYRQRYQRDLVSPGKRGR